MPVPSPPERGGSVLSLKTLERRLRLDQPGIHREVLVGEELARTRIVHRSAKELLGSKRRFGYHPIIFIINIVKVFVG